MTERRDEGPESGCPKWEAADIWRKYERGLDYGRITNRYDNAEKCWRFFEGDQWSGIEVGGDLPIYNIIKPVVNYKKARIAMNTKNITFTMEEADELGILEAINKQVREAWEFGKMDSICWEAAERGLVEGDAFIYFSLGEYFRQGEKFTRCSSRKKFVQMLDGTQIFLGNEEEPELQEQPYIIVADRQLTERVRRDARSNGLSEEEIEKILADERSASAVTTNDAEEQKGVQRTTVLLYLERVDGGIAFCRATKEVIIQPVQVIKGLDYYPFVSYTVARQKGKARGIGEVKPMIANQIEINRTLVRRISATKMSAYPKLVYLESMIRNPADLEAPGAKIAVEDGMNINSISQAIGYVQPAQMSGDAVNLENELISMSKELAGAGDAALGNINPEQASGAAITAVQDQADIPMNREVSAFAQMIEDIAILWFHLIAAYNPDKYAGTNGEAGAGALASLCPEVKIEISSAMPDTVTARINTLYNLLGSGHIDFDQFLELVGGESNLPVAKLQKIREEAAEAQRMAEGAVLDAEAEQITQELQSAELEGMMSEGEAGNMFAGMMGG